MAVTCSSETLVDIQRTPRNCPQEETFWISTTADAVTPFEGKYVRFKVVTAVTMKNAVFWDVMPCGSFKNQSFGGTWHLYHQGDFGFIHSVRRLLVTANGVPNSPILVTLMMQALRSSETSVLTRAAQRNIEKTAFFNFISLSSSF
jgi:hypothetical protein